MTRGWVATFAFLARISSQNIWLKVGNLALACLPTRLGLYHQSGFGCAKAALSSRSDCSECRAIPEMNFYSSNNIFFCFNFKPTAFLRRGSDHNGLRMAEESRSRAATRAIEESMSLIPTVSTQKRLQRGSPLPGLPPVNGLRLQEDWTCARLMFETCGTRAWAKRTPSPATCPMRSASVSLVLPLHQCVRSSGKRIARQRAKPLFSAALTYV